MPDEQTVAWQQRLDREFPRGVIATWSGTGDRAVYQIPRPLVLRVSGGQPVLLMPLFSGSDKVLGPWQVSSYERHGPRTGLRRTTVTFEDEPREMVWNSNVPRPLATLMNPDRELFFKLAPLGGRAAQHDPEEQ